MYKRKDYMTDNK